MSKRLCIAVFVLPLLVACGEPFVGEEFQGTPVFRIEGLVEQGDPAREAVVETPERLRLSLFWIGFDSRDQERRIIEQSSDVDSQFATFDMALFDAPPEPALRFGDLAGGSNKVGVALIVLYADNNFNELLNSYSTLPGEGPDTVVGASATHVVVYAREEIDEDSEAARIFGTPRKGYHLYENAGGAVCPFLQAGSCPGQGDLAPVLSEEAQVILALKADPSQVLVPNPEVPPDGTSGTEPPDNLYSER